MQTQRVEHTKEGLLSVAVTSRNPQLRNPKRSKAMTKKNKLELIAITPEMSKEEIRINLLKLLKRQGIEVKDKT